MIPGAERFSAKQGDPPAFEALAFDPDSGRDVLVGYAFLTSDFPPEEVGYNGPIEVLVGLDLEGTLTGVAVVGYYESLRSSRGDFLRSQGFQEQFTGKSVADPFRIRVDIDGISGATISVAAMARGIRNAARRAAATHLASSRLAVPDPLSPNAVTAEQLEPLSWLDIVGSGLVQRMTLVEWDRTVIDVSGVHLRDAEVAEALMGSRAYEDALVRMGGRAHESHLLLVGVDGPMAALFHSTAVYLVQDDDTLRVAPRDLHMLGAPREGKLDGQFASFGVLLIDPGVVDGTRPFTLVLDLRPAMGYTSVEFPGLSPPSVPRVAAAPESSPVTTAREEEPTAARDVAPEEVEEAPAARTEVEEIELALEETSSRAAPPADLSTLAFVEYREGSLLAETLAATSWGRVWGIALLLALVSVAFAAKELVWLRWLALSATLLFLGFLDGGFLSVSHITSGIGTGPSVYLKDIPLLLLAVFTLITTLLWGRVFCGFLCPFGALQDLFERVVPPRFRRELPRRIHDRAILLKYGVLCVVLLPVLIGSNVSLFQYVEPFGTVFFFSASVTLWVIAGGVLAAVAIVPRFYCRYVCPLGGALALVSNLSPFRIRRVEQCRVCRVCEGRCPTGAIRGPEVDFRECVRCNLCENALIEGAGACRHDMEVIRPRLVQLEVPSRWTPRR